MFFFSLARDLLREKINGGHPLAKVAVRPAVPGQLHL